jgi:hypothetical protein
LELVSRTNGQIWPITKLDPDAGSYNWDLPADIPEGDYYIRMMGLKAPLFTGNFHINSATGKQTTEMSQAAKSTNMNTDPLKKVSSQESDTPANNDGVQQQQQQQPQPSQGGKQRSDATTQSAGWALVGAATVACLLR